MNKKYLALLLSVATVLFPSCAYGNDVTSSAPNTLESKADSSASSNNIGETPLDESSDEASEPPIIDETVPRVTGTFIQPWAFTSYTQSKWDRHFSYLGEAGIDTVIIQWILTDSNGIPDKSYYPCSLDVSVDNKASYMLEYVLKSAQKYDMKVFIGLNAPNEWFYVTLTDREWYISEGELGVAVANEIYSLYGKQYGDVIAGWYFEPEYYGGIGNIEAGAEFLNVYLDGLGDMTVSLPLMLSPFLRSMISASDTGKEWEAIFELAHFREGDIFCCQDSVGAGGIPLYMLNEYYAALKDAVDTKEGLHFWANNENFTSDGKPAVLDRFAKQLEISDPYVENHVTFAYSHYYSPDIIGTLQWHNDYIRYISTGEYEKLLPEQSLYNGKKTLVSQGKPYTGAVNTRNDAWDDNGIKLTDGKIPNADGNQTAYFGAKSSGAEIVIDLGKIVDGIGEFSVYNAFGAWGITNIEAITYYISDDGQKWSQAGNTAHSYQQSAIGSSGDWLMYDFKVSLAETVGARYVKAVINNNDWMWISEFAVYRYDETD